jgi:hypothetical protein
MSSQSPKEVSGDIKEHICYLAAVSGVTQAEPVDHSVRESPVRNSDLVDKGIDRARSVVAGGDADIVAFLLNIPRAEMQRIAGPAAPRKSSTAEPEAGPA